ncbi:ABC transporter ATP-binding protein [Paenibacillus sp. UMB4589-SE434]|uniref:ABC transporter ATP-binding protein n=1 Tax=Paenibacillus sp. UMB4589-SE434 TaxID=3046314 RepID=UPI00254C4E85|nr:ABC transporter ATP-binding protein [Paenibacillus sp. UMB4589-SE434]MDK8181678.1 ABC transporter ATP-binding protein [Paenibacillus sp. UMB4589-SE434]
MDVIQLKNVSKTFKIYQEKNTTLKERLVYAGRTKYIEYKALQDISLTIKSGQTIGLIGKNGSGKSTLLKIITKIIYPDNGHVGVFGKISSLLELGAGFHPDFSGRENIYMNASILGYSKKEIDLRMNDIISFSELEDFIDNPVRSYSSGMYMRLAFSIAINVDPDILLVDEVLAVGDASFQRKCINRIQELKQRGKTIVFVSHDHGIMEKLCDQVYWINDGRVAECGDPRIVINQYLTFLSDNEEKRHQLEEIKEGAEEKNPTIINSEERPSVEISRVRILDKFSNERYVLQTDDQYIFEIYYRVHKKVKSICFGIAINNGDGVLCYGTNTYIDRIDLSDLPDSGSIGFSINSLSLLPGTYFLDVASHSDDGIPYDYKRKCNKFEVRSLQTDIGLVRISHSWEIKGE